MKAAGSGVEPSARTRARWSKPRSPSFAAGAEPGPRFVTTTPVLVLPGYGDSGPEHWQKRSESRVKGALLVAPADVDSPAHTPDAVRGFSPIPLARFAFPSIVVASSDDPFSPLARAELFARSWGSCFVVLERAGHINADAGFGEWPQGRMLLRELTGAS